ncbi:MAG: rod shape-determining protein MreD [Candidatus Omnitrophica bacterium]|nr:rod shape-determining protein MreD [Candidatus Omnitrophota bacterium]
MFRWTKALLLVGVFFTLEASLFFWIPDVLWIPNLSFLVVIFSGLKYGPGPGIFAGSLLGVLSDGISAGGFGFFVAAYSLAGGICGWIRESVFLESPISQIIVPLVFQAVIYFVLAALTSFEDDGPRWFLWFEAVRLSPIWITALFGPWFFRWYEEILEGRPSR